MILGAPVRMFETSDYRITLACVRDEKIIDATQQFVDLNDRIISPVTGEVVEVARNPSFNPLGRQDGHATNYVVVKVGSVFVRYTHIISHLDVGRWVRVGEGVGQVNPAVEVDPGTAHIHMDTFRRYAHTEEPVKLSIFLRELRPERPVYFTSPVFYID